MTALHVVVALIGVLIVARTVLSAVRTFVVPRGDNDPLTRLAFRTIRKVFDLLAPPSRPYEYRDRIMAYYGPIALVMLPAWWLALLVLGFAAIFWSLGVSPEEAFVVSSSSLVTLGFDRPAVPGGDLMAFVEAAIGLAMLALLISYLPTIYAAFSRRELLVSLLEVRADSPPSPVVMITRMHRLSGPRGAPRHVGAVGAVVRRGRGDPQLAAGPRLLPVAAAGPVVGERIGRDDGRGGARPVVGRDPDGRPGGPDDPGGLSSPCAGSGRSCRSRSSSTRSRPMRRASTGPGSMRHWTCSSSPACRSSRIATRRGSISTAGA